MSENKKSGCLSRIALFAFLGVAANAGYSYYKANKEQIEPAALNNLTEIKHDFQKATPIFLNNFKTAWDITSTYAQKAGEGIQQGYKDWNSAPTPSN